MTELQRLLAPSESSILFTPRLRLNNSPERLPNRNVAPWRIQIDGFAHRGSLVIARNYRIVRADYPFWFAVDGKGIRMVFCSDNALGHKIHKQQWLSGTLSALCMPLPPVNLHGTCVRPLS